MSAVGGPHTRASRDDAPNQGEDSWCHGSPGQCSISLSARAIADSHG